MKAVLLVDFGSTYTKVTVVDIDEQKVMATASSYTTVEDDINIGFRKALSEIEQNVGKLEYHKTLACSSAAGGLRMISSGLVPELTTKAAKMACLGAGAKVVANYSYKLTEDDIDEIDNIKPDILLLSGGIDGGNTESIINNATLLAKTKSNFPIIFAGNRNAKSKCEEILKNKNLLLAENVMPTFGKLNIDGVQKLIRDVFLQKITSAKGAKEAESILNAVLMPTPVALLYSMKLLSGGQKNNNGLGEIIGVDLGGATTDIYSISDGDPKKPTTVFRGLPEPYAKRTVEGDIGMRYSIHGIVDAVGIVQIENLSGIEENEACEMIDTLSSEIKTLPTTDNQRDLEYALAYSAIETATLRHAGTIETVYTPAGEVALQSGKDLTEVNTVVLTGGALINAKDHQKIAQGAMYSAAYANSLRPYEANVLVDKKYILSAMGLLSEHYPEVALNIMKKELQKVGTKKQIY